MEHKALKVIIYKVLFGSLFMVLLPAVLVAWAGYTADVVQLPVPHIRGITEVLILAGLLLVLSAMGALWVFGQGLPMNAYPPRYFVTRGAYALCSNPIYVGSVLITFGLSMLLKSPSGFWLVSPMFTLFVIAYTVGFENERTRALFGDRPDRPFLSLPDDGAENASWKDRFAVFLLVYPLWFVLYELVIFIGPSRDAMMTNLPIDADIPFLPWTVFLYLIIYPAAALLPFCLHTKRELRSFAFDAWLATGITTLIYLTVPLAVEQRAFVPVTISEKLLAFDRAMDGVSAAMPSFHVIWAFLVARYLHGLAWRSGIVWYAAAVAVSLSCLTTGNHTLLDVIGGVVVFLLVRFRVELWDTTRRLSEAMANSWKEWHLGPVRIINHGLYGGAAAFAGALIIAGLLQRHGAYMGLVLGAAAVVGAGLWAQFIEGSPRLLRPYGYYGSVVGTLGAAVVFLFSGFDFFLLLGAVSMSAPWVQAIGRLRCLVQGCCHGRPASSWLGIRFTHEMSRVNSISGLCGSPLHPTQLYSIAGNIVTGIILVRLYTLHVPASFITGVYLLLNSLIRFVEESFRGEAQTPLWKGMRIYQWIAMVNLVAGIAFTCVPSAALPAFAPGVRALAWSVVTALLATVAYGVDIPSSKRRFSRLTS